MSKNDLAPQTTEVGKGYEQFQNSGKSFQVKKSYIELDLKFFCAGCALGAHGGE